MSWRWWWSSPAKTNGFKWSCRQPSEWARENFLLVVSSSDQTRSKRSKRRSETSLSFMLVLLVNGGRMHVRDGDVRMELPLAFSQFHQISSDVPTMFFEWRNGIQIVAHQFPFVHQCQLFVYPWNFLEEFTARKEEQTVAIKRGILASRRRRNCR